MGEVIPFPEKTPDGDLMDDEEMFGLTINGKGQVNCRVNKYIKTPEQFNWLIAKVAESFGGLIYLKDAAIENGPSDESHV